MKHSLPSLTLLALLLARCSSGAAGADAAITPPDVAVEATIDRDADTRPEVRDEDAATTPDDLGPHTGDIADGATGPGVDAAGLDAADAADRVEPLDITLIEDLPLHLSDLPSGPGDVAAPDAGGACTAGLTDRCPASAPGPCAPLPLGRPTQVRVSGLNADILLSCEGSLTRNGRDGVVPLVVHGPGELTLTAQPVGSDLVVLALYRADGCGLPSGEVRCVNPSRLGEPARITVSSVEPGTYFVAVTALLGGNVTLLANLSPARPRRRGDACPGVPIAVDGPATSLNTDDFQRSADYGTSCGADSSASAWVDAVFSYTLSQRRDVTVEVSSLEGGPIAMEVGRTCGRRDSALPPCVSGASVRRTIRDQAPGTWYVAVDRRASSSAVTLRARVTTTEPSPLPPADRCPGFALAEGAATQVATESLQGDEQLRCLRAQRADAYFTLVAPPAERDVLLNVRGAGDPAAVSLQTRCGEPSTDCVASAEREGTNIWRRLQGLTPGEAYTLAVGTSQPRDAVSVRYLSVPAGVRSAVSGNNSCGRAAAIPPAGGLLSGSTSSGERLLSTACGGLACLGGRRVYHRLSLTERRRVVINTLGSSFDTLLHVLSGDCPGRAVEGACSDNAMGTAAMLDVTLDAGSYLVVVAGCGVTAQGNYALDVTSHPP